MPLTKPNLTKPKIGGDPDVWGDKLNKNIDLIDSFNKSIVDDGARQDEELSRLENEKINKTDLDTLVKNVVDNYVDAVTKPDLGNHVNTVNKPELDRYTETKKSEINTFTEAQKVELDEHEKAKEGEITQFVEAKKDELVQYVDTVSKVEINSHTENKKQEIDSFTEEQKVELDAHEKLKEGQLDAYEKTKEGQLDNHVETVNKVELKNYVDSKKSEIDNFTEEQKVELNEHEKLKEGEFDEYIAGKIGGIDSHVESKKDEINTFTEEQKVELDAYEKVKEGQLESFKDEKKVEITSHTDAEIERINATGVDGKQDKTDNALETKDKTVVGAINELLSEKENLITRSNAINSESTTDVATSKAVNDLRLEVDKKTINAGDGLATTIDVGGGQTISITPKNESILVDNDSIWVNIVNDFTTGGVNKVASAESIKVLKQLIDTLGGGGATKLLRASEALGEYDYIGNLPSGGISITVGTRLFNPTLYLDGVRFEENRYSVEFETGLITLNEPYADYDVVWVVEDQMPYHVTFCFPTMNLLLASEDIKSRIKLGNVIKILGESDEDDGGHYLVKCEDTSKLNAVDIGEGRFLNEIPNTRISSIKAQVDQNKSDILLKANDEVSVVISNYLGIEEWKFSEMRDLQTTPLDNDPSKSSFNAIFNFSNTRDKGFAIASHYGLDSDFYIRGYTDNPSGNNGSNYKPFCRLWTNASCTISKSSRGWVRFANGLILQWGMDKIRNTFQGQNITLPIPFSNKNYTVTFGGCFETVASYGTVMPVSNYSRSSESFGVVTGGQLRGNVQPSAWAFSTEEVYDVSWMAIGY